MFTNYLLIHKFNDPPILTPTVSNFRNLGFLSKDHANIDYSVINMKVEAQNIGCFI